ncbi:MAG: hypothetical protein OES24_09930 [Acidimicrobiia bacterium]|nr:hypothetical protein [Acidimicrobiia bacterium]
MSKKLKGLGTVLAVIGAICLIASGVALYRTQQGMDALQKFSEAQNVTLSYDDDGNLIDRGTTEGADAIMTMLTDEWGYPVLNSEFDPDDPVVNTASEYMFQMATIVYHVRNGTQTVVLDEDVEYNGETFAAGTYEFEVDGRYWTDFDRQHPIEGPAREQAWSGTVHGLVGELGVGVVTHTSIQVGYALSGVLAILGLLSMLTGLGMFWMAREPEIAVMNGHKAKADRAEERDLVKA